MEINGLALSAEEMAEVASRHGHKYEAALQAIRAHPGRWIRAVMDWIEAERQEKQIEARIARDAAWRPNDQHLRVLASLRSSPRRTPSSDPASSAQLGASVRALVRRGWLRRIESDAAVEYAVLRD